MMPDPTRHRDRPAAGSRTKAPVSLAAGDTVVAFTWSGDRWRHEVTSGGRWIAESVEGAGDGDATWPASPALVELSLVDAGGTAAVVAVGLVGRSHFSASITPHPTQPDTLRFEIAGRLQEAPRWLGSTYRTPTGIARTPATHPPGFPATVTWAYTIGPEGILAEAASDAG
jgi:hypothetical protein